MILKLDSHCPVADIQYFAYLKPCLQRFGKSRPARSCVQVVNLPLPEAIVEIEVIAQRLEAKL